jgi:trehalose/maltose hydrolase-like predicted phosphorylase
MRGRTRRCVLLCSGALAVCSVLARAEDSSFQLETHSLQPYTAAYLGNGAIGVETSVLGVTGTQCFLAGVYDKSPGDVPRIVSAPAWNEIEIYNGSRWLSADTSSPNIENYDQVLDMYDGVLRTSYVWAQDNRRIAVRVEEFVFRNTPDCAGMRLVLTPEFAGKIRIRFPLHNWPAPHRYALAEITKLAPRAEKDPWLIWYPGRLDTREVHVRSFARSAVSSFSGLAPGTHVMVNEAVAAQWDGAASTSVHKGASGASAEISFRAQPGMNYTFTKYLAVVTPGAPFSHFETAVDAAKELQRQGWNNLLAKNSSAWHQLWETDIVVDGDPSLQRVIHSMLFYLISSTRKDLSVSTAPMGLSSAGYYGHIFWDADTFMFPPLLILHPDLARPMVAFRSRTRGAARRNGQVNGFRGAMYPWEADADGNESTPRFAGQNAKYENHINGDVALAAWQYWLATGDREWLERDCWPILRDTADFWTSRVSYNASDRRYEIGNVVAVKESLIGVKNDAWTNAIARKNLELADTVAQLVHQRADPRWRQIADALYVPESDSALLWFPLDLPHSREQTQSAIQSMMDWIHRGETGAMMGGEFYPILAAQLGERARIAQMLGPLSTAYLRPPFQVIAETPQNRNTNFITGAGAFLQQFVFGYSGLRFTEKGLEQEFTPVLPPGVRKVILKNITVRGEKRTFVFTEPK